MKASESLDIIRDNLKYYPIENLKNKATDSNHKNSIIKMLAKYNSSVYDDIYETDIIDDFEINNKTIENLCSDINYYFDKYSTGNDDIRKLNSNIILYLALIAKKPLHPYGEDEKDEIYVNNGVYYCKGREKFINDENSLCKYCVCQNPGLNELI